MTPPATPHPTSGLYPTLTGWVVWWTKYGRIHTLNAYPTYAEAARALAGVPLPADPE